MVTELTDGIYWFDLTGVNAYLVADPEELVLVDTGTRFDAGTIESGIVEAGFRLDALDRILITHYDVDHVGGLGTLAVDAPIHVGSPDDSLLTGSRKPLLSGLKSFTQRVSSPLIPAIDPRRVSVVADGERIGNFTATHTPGHTPGHTVYVHEELSAAFLGDAII
ncbi:MAG: MBL fold metallo-hydrolase, partial [Natronomonas sp.]